MRQYLLGAFVLVVAQLNSRALCQNSNPNQNYGNPYFKPGAPEGLNDRDISAASSSYEENDLDAVSGQRNPGEIYGDDGYSGEYVPGDYESDPYQPRDDVAYWESIYGTEDVPDFEVPPPIDGESIFMGLDDLMDSWEDQDQEEDQDTEETILRKRDATENGAKNENVQKLWPNSGNLDYRDVMTRVHEPHFYEPKSRQDSETSSSSESESEDESEEDLNESQSSSGTSSSLEQSDSVRGSSNVGSQEPRSGDFEDSQDVDAELESELEFTGQYPVHVEPRSIKSSPVAESWLNSKRKVIQAKKDLINVAAAGSSKAEVSGAVHRTLEAKKDLINSVISAKASAIQHKQELLHSITGSDHSHGYSRNSQISGYAQSQGSLQSVLDAKQAGFNDAVVKTLDAKKELVDLLGSGISHGTSEAERHSIDKEAELAGDVSETLLENKGSGDSLSSSSGAEIGNRMTDAKKDFIESAISARSGAIQRKKEFSQSIIDFHHSHGHSSKSGSSGSMKSQDSLQSVLDAKRKVIQAKKDLIHASTAGSEAEVTDALSKTLDAKKDLVDTVLSTGTEFGDRTIAAKKDIDSVVSAKSSAIQNKKEFLHSASDFSNNHGYSGNSRILGSMRSRDKFQKVIQAKKDLIHASAAGNEAELTDALGKALEAKKDLVDSLVSTGTGISDRTMEAKKDFIDAAISAKADAIQKKKEFLHSISDFDYRHGHSGHSTISGSIRSRDKFQKVIQAKKDLIHVSTVGSKAELSDAVVKTLEAKKDLVDSLLSDRAGIIHDKKEFGHSTCCFCNTAENSFSSVYRNKGASLNPSSQVGGQIYTNHQSGSIHDHHHIQGAELSSGLATIQDKISSLHSSVGGVGNIAISEGIEVASTSSSSNHKEGSSLIVNKKIESGSEISSSLQSGQSGADYLGSSDQIHLAGAGNSRTEFSSGVTTVQDRKSSHHSSVSGASHIAVGGEVRATSSSTHINDGEHKSLIFSGEIESSSEIKSGSQLPGSISSQSDKVSLESAGLADSADAENSETNTPVALVNESTNIDADGEPEVTTSDSKSSSEELSGEESDSESTVTQSSSELAGHSIGKFSAEAEINENTEIKSSDGNIFGTDLANGLPVAREECASGQCGISGKLHVDLNTQVDNSFQLHDGRKSVIESEIPYDLRSSETEEDLKEVNIQSQNTQIDNNSQLHDGPETVIESEIPYDLSSSETEEDLIEVNTQSSVTDQVVIVDTGYTDEKLEKIPVYEDRISNYGTNENEEAVVDVVERTPDVDHYLVNDNESDQPMEGISQTQSAQFYGDQDDDDDQLALTEPKDAILDNEEELESIGGEPEFVLETQIDVDEQIEGKQDTIAVEQSGNAIIRSEISEAEETVLEKDEEEEKDLDINHNGRIQVSVKFGDLENRSNYNEHESSTEEAKPREHFSGADDQYQESQKNREISHFQYCDASSRAFIPEDVEEFKASQAFSNAHCRLINLDVNCSGMTAFLKPECQQLNAHLWHPQDAVSPITLWTVKTYLSHGQELAVEMQTRARWLCDQGLVPKLHTPAMLHLINNLATENTVGINHESEFSLFGTKLLQRRLSSHFDVTPNTFVEFLEHHAFRVIGTGLCHDRPKRCQVDQMYRTLDGSCNNRIHPTWGQCNTAFARILPARYADGVHQPPRSVTGSELPNPRTLSVHCLSRKVVSSAKITLALSQWAQILSHDFALQTIDQTVEGGIQCCADGKRQLPKSLQHHSCLPIDIPTNDKFYSKFDSRCMNFVRSMTISREDCTLGPADQLNTVTSYLDVSPLYGSNKETCDQLRAFKGGRMLVEIRRGRELLPTITNSTRSCDVMSSSEVCYLAGDVRVNQNPQLAILQTVLLREHNRIADELTALNPHWDDERVFQETRKIVIAEYQHITYREWLPLVIGKKYGRRHRLISRCQDTMSQDYDPRIKASTINGFSAAAFRLFHSMVDGNINLCPANREISHTLRLSNHFFRPQIIERSNNFDDLIRGLVTQPMQESDKNFHPEITEYLFRSRNEFGMDLEAIDIQRGRDHGLPCYNAYRKTCGLPRATDFDDLKGEISLESIERLKSVYAHVDDIDLFVGAALEIRSPGSILGPVARCLIGEQFYRSRIGDRYFYDVANQPHSFTQEQFEEIKKASFARLLCDTGDNLEEIQPRAFRLISSRNPLTCCDAIPKIDLSAWQESEYQ